VRLSITWQGGRGWFAIALPALLSACGGGESAADGGVSPTEARMLDEAAEMLDERNDVERIDSGEPLPGEEPAEETGSEGEANQ